MILTTQLTRDYYSKAQPLIQSVKRYWPGAFKIGAIGFHLHDAYHIPIDKVRTYRNNYPSNRPFFVTTQGGEFLDFMDVPDDEVIMCIDADCVMQRAFTEEEIKEFTPEIGQIIVTYPRKPPQALLEVSANLKFKHTDKFPDLDNFEFCGAFLVARADTFRRLADHVADRFDDLVEVNSHHAGIQFLISYVGYRYFDIKIVSNIYQVGDWYLEDYNFSHDGKKLLLDGECVVFNHTKFHPRYNNSTSMF